MQSRCAKTLSAITIAVAVSGIAGEAHAQPTEICGDGTTTTVRLPSVSPTEVEEDVILVPNGCRIYLLIASDYGRNRRMDELLFYPLAKFVAENGGYVHYSWWNNLLRPYMGGALHPATNQFPNDPGPLMTVGLFESVLGIDFLGDTGADELYVADAVKKLNLGKLSVGLVVTALDQLLDLLRRSMVHVPDGTQFAADAREFVESVRHSNPNALILLAGHGYGATGLLKAARGTSAAIDLVALIDPIGTDALPVGFQRGPHVSQPELAELTNFVLGPGPKPHTNPQTRWRAIHDFLGYQQADCIRDGLFCQDFDPRFLRFEFRCKAPGAAWLDRDPFPASWAPLSCPGPLVHAGKRIALRSNVKFLYHRWQWESGPPLDFAQDYYLDYPAPRDTGWFSLAGPNIQGAVHNTCLEGVRCDALDGHDEIVGFRGVPLLNFGAQAVTVRTPVGVRARQWPGDEITEGTNVRVEDVPVANVLERRDKLVEMAQPINYADWTHSPTEPTACLVCGELVVITRDLLNKSTPPLTDTAAPSTVATVDPGANAAGWHTDDVVVDFIAADEGSSGLKEIEYSLAGATTGAVVTTPGGAARAIIAADGVTNVSFLARDNAGNEAATQSLDVRIDRTPPTIAAVEDRAANANGWHNTSVVVSFAAHDHLSGLATSTDPVTVDTEGAEQAVDGTATDTAGNQAGASAVLNIDRTNPAIDIRLPQDGAVFPLNATIASDYTCSDSLSGLASCSGTSGSGQQIQTASVGTKSFEVAAADRAGNQAILAHAYSVQYVFSGFHNPALNASALNVVNAGRTVPIKYQLKDARGDDISDLSSFVSLVSFPVPCGDTASGVPAEETDTAGESTLRYDAETGQFVYNWKTDRSWTGCRLLKLQLADGTNHTAAFWFR